MRTHFAQLQDVKVLLEEMERAGGMDVETKDGATMQELVEPQADSKKRSSDADATGSGTSQRPGAKGRTSEKGWKEGQSWDSQKSWGGNWQRGGGSYHPAAQAPPSNRWSKGDSKGELNGPSVRPY